LSSTNVQTGFGTEARVDLARIVNTLTGSTLGEETFGVDIPAMQVFKAVSETLVNSKLNEATGPQTDQDAMRIRSTMASLDKESEANRFLIATMKETNRRKIEQHKFYQKFYSDNDTLKGADAAWLDYKMQTPMIGSITDVDTGMPMLYSDFLRKAKRDNPGANQTEITDAWRSLNGP
jgi:hypothetical protein